MLRQLSDRFLDLERRVFSTSQVPPLDRLTALTSGHCQVVGFTNPFSFQILTKRLELVTEVEHWYSDGGLLCRTIGWGRGGPLPRYSFDFSSIAGGVFDHAQNSGIPVALFGGTEEEITIARSYLQDRYPNLDIVWHRNGYFRDPGLPDGGRAKALDELTSSGAGIVIIGMGTPLQEEVAVALKQRLLARDNFAGTGPCTIFTCGGFLSQTAQGGDYYPEIIKKIGLRWVYRAYHEPHVRHRLMRDYPRFAAQVAACQLFRKITLQKCSAPN